MVTADLGKGCDSGVEIAKSSLGESEGQQNAEREPEHPKQVACGGSVTARGKQQLPKDKGHHIRD